jgi:hypothetical protein
MALYPLNQIAAPRTPGIAEDPKSYQQYLAGDDWFASQGAPPPINYPGGSATFDERTGQYRNPGLVPDGVGGAPATGNPTDKNYVMQQVVQKGREMQAAGQYVNPSVFNDPGYWADRIIEQGGWGNFGADKNNIGYFSMRFGQPEGAPQGGGGRPGAGGMAGMAGIGDPSAMQAALEQSPGFQFRLGEGLKALERSAAARGTLLTGGTLKGLQRYAQDYASNEYGQRVNQLQSLASLGVNAAGAAGGAASAYGENAGNLLTGAGNALAAGGIGAANAQAAGQINAANAWTGGINNATNQALQMYYLSRMFPGGGATPPMVYGGGGPQMIPPAIIPTMTTPIPPIPR